MKLSILDLAPVGSGQTAKDALEGAVRLAQLAEELGYERYWIAEHHDLYGLACPNPDVMLGVIGAKTEHIRIGAGAVLLPYYKPFRVAETYHLLATLFPGRIDVGFGRAPGGSAEVSLALSDNYLKQVSKYEQLIDEVLAFIHQDFPSEHPYSGITPTPVPAKPPRPWLLGTSLKSAELAARKSLDYAFAHFMTDADGPAVVAQYRRELTGKKSGNVIVAVQAICAATREEAEELAMSAIVWKLKQDQWQEQKQLPSVEEAKNYPFTEAEWKKVAAIKEKLIIGSPEDVKQQLDLLNHQYDADEWMIVSPIHDEQAKRTSYRLMKQAVSKT